MVFLKVKITSRVDNLIGKGLFCHESRCRIETDSTRILNTSLKEKLP